jgi:hypothetical protein
LQPRKVLLDKSCGIFVADGNCRGALETLIEVEKVEPRISAFVDAKALYVRAC